jgi:membrane-associated phospholipid phosphatase
MYKSLIIQIIIILSFITFAQNTSQLKSDINHIIKTSKEYFLSPSKFDSKDFQTVGILGVIVSASSLLDDDIKNFSQRNFDSTNFLLRSFDSYYHIEFMSATFLGLYIFGNLADKNEPKQLSVNLLTSSFLTGITTLGLKTLFGRSRPYVADNQYEFNWFEFDYKFSSFPSGHTSLAFSFSTIMAEQNKTLLWKSIWFSAATLVGISRIYNNQHWFSDVLLGAAIGYITAKFVLKHNNNDTSDNLNLPTNNIVFLIRL